MHKLLLAGLLSIVLVAAVTPPARGEHRGAHQASPLVKPGHKVNGLTPGEWLARWWRVVLETPSPLDAYPGCAPLGRGTVAVIFPPAGGETSCTVRKGSTLMLVPNTTGCSDWEPPPFFGATPAERRACSIRLNEGADINEVTVDGRFVRLTDAYRAQAPDLRVRLPEDNLLGAPAGTVIRTGADGWMGFTKPLRRGRHEIVIHAAGTYLDEPYELTGLLHVDVVR
jgi:hypothetical protein